MNLFMVTGAGLSAPSGLGTYRGKDGIWVRNPALEQKSTGDYYYQHREEMQPYWADFREKVRFAEPNEAHMALARLQHKAFIYGDSVLIVTQNVDELHQKAIDLCLKNGEFGETEANDFKQNVLELHGNIMNVRCMENFRSGGYCENDKIWRYETETDDRCNLCNGWTRPNAVFFGEMRSKPILDRIEKFSRSTTDFVAIGTTGIVYPVNDIAGWVKLNNGAKTSLVNLERWENEPDNNFDNIILGDCTKSLPNFLSGFYNPDE